MRPTVPWQRGLQHFNGCLFLPNSVDGTGAWDKWDSGSGTVTHATVGTAYDTQFKRTIWKNSGGGGTNDQMLGPRKVNTGDYQFWLGNDKYLGGWYLSAIFRIEVWNSDAGRLFIGMTGNAAAVCTSDAVPQHTCGLWHDTTDGQDVLNFVFRSTGAQDKTTTVTTHAANPGILAANNTFLWEMWAFPNGHSVINTNWKLSQFDVTNDSHGVPYNRVKKVKWQETGGMTNSLAVMMAPQCQMSNGADTTINHFGMSVANVYATPWSGEQD
jgi:hypothetical protein